MVVATKGAIGCNGHEEEKDDITEVTSIYYFSLSLLMPIDSHLLFRSIIFINLIDHYHVEYQYK